MAVGSVLDDMMPGESGSLDESLFSGNFGATILDAK
jgi:hypothetical protein